MNVLGWLNISTRKFLHPWEVETGFRITKNVSDTSASTGGWFGVKCKDRRPKTDNSAGLLSTEDELRRNVREGAAVTLARALLPRLHVDILPNYQAIAW